MDTRGYPKNCYFIYGEGLRATGGLLDTDCSKAPGVGFGVILTKCFGVGVSCRILYYFVGYLYESASGSITSVGEKRAYMYLSAVVYL